MSIIGVDGGSHSFFDLHIHYYIHVERTHSGLHGCSVDEEDSGLRGNHQPSSQGTTCDNGGGVESN